MRRLLTVLAILSAAPAFSQGFEVTALAGYTTPGGLEHDTRTLDDLKLASQTERSNAEDVDMVHAISDFQNKQSGYDAALKSYAMVQRLSLFQYVNGG